MTAFTPGESPAQVPWNVITTVGTAVLGNSVSMAGTFAVAHTVGGTGAATSGTCLKTDGPVFFRASSASCSNSDSFTHSTPPGNDYAVANASASSSLLGGGGAMSSPTVISKGDFAAAGALARSGYQFSINAAIPVGAPAAAVSFTLPGGSTFTASKDPETTYYGIMASDLGLLDLNSDLLAASVSGMRFTDYLPPDALSTLRTPSTVYWALILKLNGASGVFDVSNFGTMVTTPLTKDDFEDVSNAGQYSFSLNGSRSISFNVPVEVAGPSEQSVEFEIAEMHVGAVPEPSTTILMASALVCLGGVARIRGRR